MKEKSRQTARVLVQAGITQRDAAELMGISNQRVSQLVNA
ncbi:helix-turn-helix transcriptional regulator [Mobiluncus mulieris]|uniref:Helix-turn-helix transcriptional regulator n=1 Tax=Mobiluncus mulieris TaxID=2052 RepID=A0A848RM85_9ACTO|nr:helix-turn-helix transcriptional regulator [Mobiluncus mulieris]MCU9975539.1 helix-turn-helix transcriptional regulator [Mobiluncus mulieris]MCU9994149.1 helix-turn-helix transcriptional regulator [Mobiluncus mulieris]MCV0013777.1 helix-turn-helix transcriptional regulator [Mobiluncus mulieris]NMW62976.1 helix-turn-helix transcriptional regulator [Mobiluncus mulieris]